MRNALSEFYVTVTRKLDPGMLTEDLQDGQDVDGLGVVNPFGKPPA